MIELTQIIELGVGAAVGFGAFAGSTKASIRGLKEILSRMEKKLDSFDEKLVEQKTILATRPCLLPREQCPDESAAGADLRRGHQ